MTVFTVDLAGTREQDRAAAIDGLARALHAEFPAFRVAQVTVLDDRAVLQVAAYDGTPAHAVERLDGWGHVLLTLSIAPEHYRPTSGGRGLLGHTTRPGDVDSGGVPLSRSTRDAGTPADTTVKPGGTMRSRGGVHVAGDEDRLIEIAGMDVPDYLRPTYANFANVGHTPFDFRLTFALLKSPRPGSEADHVQSTGTIVPEAVADLIIPIGVVPGLIAALRENYDKYLDQYGLPGIGREAEN